jgi:hypothetical protein
MYMSLQGKLFAAPIIAGVPGAFRWLGNMPDFAPAFATDKFEHKEAWSGQRQTDLVITTANTSTVEGTIEDWSPANVAMLTRGKAVKQATTAVVDEVGPATLVAGDLWVLKNVKVASLTVEDSAATPANLVLNTDYTADLELGVITVIDPTGFTLPFKASYTPAAADVVAFFSQPITEVALRFEGVNTADGNKKVVAEFYKVSVDPTSEFPLIHEEAGQTKLNGNLLIDATKPASDQFGQFGRLIYL